MNEEIDILLLLKKELNNYLGSVSDSQAVFIATLDGHLLLERSRDEFLIDQIVPMSGSILGIADSISKQIMQQNLQDNIIIMENNILAMLKINDADDSLFLGVICKRTINLGKMITFAKLTISQINTHLKNTKM